MATIAKCSWVSGSAWAAQSWEPLPKEGRTEADATWQTWSFGFRTWDICRSASECIGVPNGAFGSLEDEDSIPGPTVPVQAGQAVQAVQAVG
jgi:hypothetical protein